MAKNNEIKYKTNAVDLLKKMIQDWVEEKPSTRNVSTIIKKSGVNDSCIRRVLNSDSLPAPINLYKILKTILNPEKNFLEITDIPEDFRSSFENTDILQNFNSGKNYISIDQIEEHLKNPTSLMIFERASIGDCISSEEVKEMYGKYGDSLLKNLVSLKILISSDGVLKVSPDFKDHVLQGETLKSFVSETTSSFYKTESCFNYLFGFSDNISPKGYNKAMDVLENTQFQLRAIVKENPGDIPFFTSGVMDTMTFKNIFSKKEKQS